MTYIKVDGKLKQVDGGNRYVYGVNSGNVLYYRPVDGSGAWQTPKSNNRAKYVTATGDNKVYIVGLDDKVYQCNTPCADGEWTKLSDDTLAQIDGSLNLLVGVDQSDRIYYTNA